MLKRNREMHKTAKRTEMKVVGAILKISMGVTTYCTKSCCLYSPDLIKSIEINF